MGGNPGRCCNLPEVSKLEGDRDATQVPVHFALSRNYRLAGEKPARGPSLLNTATYSPYGAVTWSQT